MTFKSFFQLNPTSNIEEYQKVLSTRRLIFSGMLLVGLMTFLLSYLLKMDSAIHDFCSGMGVGILSVSIVLLIQNEWIKRNKTKLKIKRLKEIDERNQMVSRYAMVAAARVMIILLGILVLIFGFIHPIVSVYLSVGICATCLLYVGFYHYFNKKM